MKAISLWEPWASLIAIGMKRYETRSWTTNYRGPLLICASKKRLPFVEIANLLMMARLTLNDLQYGKAVAIVDLIDILKTDNFIVEGIEGKFGDFSPGRYAWKLDHIRRFIKSPWIRGKQGLFDAAEMYKNLETYAPI